MNRYLDDDYKTVMKDLKRVLTSEKNFCLSLNFANCELCV